MADTDRRIDLMTHADLVASSRANAVRYDAEADALADLGEFTRAAAKRRDARLSREEADLQERAADVRAP